MPFTLAHPAVILLLPRNRYLQVLPLIAGSLAPDLTYFLPEQITRVLPNCHQLPGAVTVAPVAAFMCLAVARLLDHSPTSLLWGRHRHVVSSALRAFGRTRADWLAAVPAVAAGICLRLAWDAFTHPYGWPVRHWPVLRTSLVAGRDGFELFRILQWISSIAGVAALVATYVRALRSSSPITPVPAIPFPRSAVLQVVVVAAIVSGVVRALAPPAGFASLHGRMYLATTTGLALFVCLYVLGGIVSASQEKAVRF